MCLSVSLSSHLLLLSPLQVEQPSSTAQTAFTTRKPVRFLLEGPHSEFYPHLPFRLWLDFVVLGRIIEQVAQPVPASLMFP